MNLLKIIGLCLKEILIYILLLVACLITALISGIAGLYIFLEYGTKYL